MLNIPCELAKFSDPDGIYSLSLNDTINIACCMEEYISFHIYVLITRLNHFTLSHFGSNTFLSTLKPNLTTSAPRLDTGSLLEIARFGVSPNYILSTELAHPSIKKRRITFFHTSLIFIKYYSREKY